MTETERNALILLLKYAIYNSKKTDAWYAHMLPELMSVHAELIDDVPTLKALEDPEKP